jgi:Ca-activated chloride channel family protein
MKSHNLQAASDSEPSAIAWAISAVFHVSAILLMALAVSDARQGATSLTSDAAGIVLTLSPAEGELYEGDDGPGESAAAFEMAAPPNLLASEPNDNAAAATATDLTPISAVQPAAADVVPSHPTPPSTRDVAATPNVDRLPATSIFAADVGRRGSPAGRDYAQVRVFGVEGRGNKFVYVFDRSASMEGPPLAAAKRQLVDSLGSLTGVHQFHIIFFNHELQSFDIAGGGRRIAFGSDRDKQLAANFVGGITAWGGTDRYTALKAALAFRPDVIFFLTDADDPMPDYELRDILSGSDRAGATICVIEFGRDRAPDSENFLQALARQSGGQYGYVNTARLAW